MDEILNYSMNEMAKASFDCSCGRHHTLDIDKLVMGQGVIKELPEMVKGLGAKKVYIQSSGRNCGNTVEGCRISGEKCGTGFRGRYSDPG